VGIIRIVNTDAEIETLNSLGTCPKHRPVTSRLEPTQTGLSLCSATVQIIQLVYLNVKSFIMMSNDKRE
jgi:hypothetical protein